MKMTLFFSLLLLTAASLNGAAIEQGAIERGAIEWGIVTFPGLYHGANSPHVTRRTSPIAVSSPRRTPQELNSHQGSPLAHSPLGGSTPRHSRSKSDTDIKELVAAANVCNSKEAILGGKVTHAQIAAATAKLQLLATTK